LNGLVKAEQKVILITGCSSGIGYEVAKGLVARGYRVFATARKQKDVDKLNAEGLESLSLDLADSDSIQTAVSELLKRTNGKLYALFNNGAYGQPGAVEDLSRAVLREQFEVNLLGTHELTCLVLPVMRAQGAGRIIQNSSVLGLITLKYRGAYNASKFALEGLTDTLRMELKGSGVAVSLIEPGPITSRFRANAFAAYQKNIDTENSPHRQLYRSVEKRLGSEGEVAPFTLGPEAVLKQVIHALESEHPKARYYVTFPTHLFAFLRRILPVQLLDKILIRTSGFENR
jgi:NAD(P)-dependent dehydrogenase (short-subunit alcohol dehydrogenase family)